MILRTEYVIKRSAVEKRGDEVGHKRDTQQSGEGGGGAKERRAFATRFVVGRRSIDGVFSCD